MKQYVRRSPDIIRAVQFTKPEDVQHFLANDQTLSAYVAEVCDVPHPMIDGLFLQTMVIRRKGQVFKTALFHGDWLVYEDGILKRFTDAEFHEKFAEKVEPKFPWGIGDSITVPPFKPDVTAKTPVSSKHVYTTNHLPEVTFDDLKFQHQQEQRRRHNEALERIAAEEGLDPIKAADHEFIRNEAQELDRQMTDMMRKQREDLKRKGLDL